MREESFRAGVQFRHRRKIMKTLLWTALGTLVAASCAAVAQVPAGYPPGYADIVAAARKEGSVVVYSVTSSVPLLLQDFQLLYPDVKLDYIVLDTGPLYDRVVAETTSGPTADVVWS